jgi:hypothetical protein
MFFQTLILVCPLPWRRTEQQDTHEMLVSHVCRRLFDVKLDGSDPSKFTGKFGRISNFRAEMLISMYLEVMDQVCRSGYAILDHARTYRHRC